MYNFKSIQELTVDSGGLFIVFPWKFTTVRGIHCFKPCEFLEVEFPCKVPWLWGRSWGIQGWLIHLYSFVPFLWIFVLPTWISQDVIDVFLLIWKFWHVFRIEYIYIYIYVYTYLCMIFVYYTCFLALVILWCKFTYICMSKQIVYSQGMIVNPFGAIKKSWLVNLHPPKAGPPQ